jgi:hypothetical protein
VLAGLGSRVAVPVRAAPVSRPLAAVTQAGRRRAQRRRRTEIRSPIPGPTADELLALLMSFDKNKDGKLSKAEVPERQQGLFERGDTDKNGVLDAAELKKVTADQAAAPPAPPRAPRGGFGASTSRRSRSMPTTTPRSPRRDRERGHDAQDARQEHGRIHHRRRSQAGPAGRGRG